MTTKEEQQERDDFELEPETVDDLEVDEEASAAVRGGWGCPHSAST